MARISDEGVTKMPMPIPADPTDSLERWLSALETLRRLSKEYDAALLLQPSGAARVAKRRLEIIRRQFEPVIPDGPQQTTAEDENYESDAEKTEAACANVVSRNAQSSGGRVRTG
jgi:hypothetical protein